MLHSSFSAVWITAVTIGRAFIASFSFVLRATLSAAASKAVGLSPYPYKIFRKDGYNDDYNRNIKVQGYT